MSTQATLSTGTTLFGRTLSAILRRHWGPTAFLSPWGHVLVYQGENEEIYVPAKISAWSGDKGEVFTAALEDSTSEADLDTRIADSTLQTVDYISSAQAAQTLHVTPQTVRNYVRKGILKSVTLPSGHLRISVESLNALQEV